ncbi:MAG: hypothetical protein AMXMBFR84_01720 [Candidatus Hydrogenedentota bacterium]
MATVAAENAILAFREALGEAAVDTQSETIGRYARSSSGTSTIPICILYPESTAHVQALVRAASEHGIVLYPISRGKNWGYGDACAPMSGAAIVDLSRMNRIVEVNTDLAYAIIEPGVTQGQLYEYLQRNKTGLWCDVTGAGLEASFVGNTLDRGFGHTRYGDHFLSTCGMEIVLADGRVLHTGYGHYPNAQAAHVYRYGVGPFIDGLFCQSNFGIVTKITMWLMPEPEAFCFFYVVVDDPDGVGPLIDALRPLRLNGTLPATLHIGNDLRILSAKQGYPWQESGGRTPLSREIRKDMIRSIRAGAWNMASALTGTRDQVRAGKKALRNALGGVGKLRFVDDSKLSWAWRVSGWLSGLGMGDSLRELLIAMRPLFGTLKGQPFDDAMRGAQWRLQKESGVPTADPLDVGAGIRWLSPVLPTTGRHANEVLSIVEPIFQRHGFDLLVTFTMINERAMIAVMNVAFDTSLPDEAAAASSCYLESLQALIEKGYIPYRTGHAGMRLLHSQDDVFWDVATSIKSALDPQDIISRGRYLPPLENPE